MAKRVSQLVLSNALSEDRWIKMTECLLSFDADPMHNINRLTALCGELLEADCVLYNRLEHGRLCAWGQWQTPPDFQTEDFPEGHVCYDIIRNQQDEPTVIRHLSESMYSNTDSNVRKYRLQTYIGKPVIFDGKHVGSLCAVYLQDIVPDETSLLVINAIATAIGVEEVRQSATDALRERKELFRVLAELSPDAILLIDSDGSLQYMNTVACNFFGEQSYLIGKQYGDLFSATSIEVHQRRLEEVVESGQMLSFEEVIAFPHGSVWIESRLIPARDETGKTISVMGICRNITESKQAYQQMKDMIKERTQELREKNKLLRKEVHQRKQTEKKLILREETFRTVVENALEMIFRIAPDYTFLYLNPAAQKMINLPLKKLTRWDTAQLKFPDLLITKIKKSVETVITSKKQVMTEFDLKEIGQEAYLQASLIPEFDSTGKVISILCVARDVYELRKLEEEISRLDRLNVIGEVAASIGHEVRNPMTVVRGFLQQLEIKQDLAHYKNYFDLMIDELDRANSIITEFLSLAKNKFIEVRKIHLNDVITSILPLLRAEAINHAQSIECELTDIPEIIVDPNEVRQMLINFVRNAIEASQPGRAVWIKTHVENNEVVLKVTDQGCGIAPEIRRRIGLPFTTSKENGIGLGLAVCFSIAQRHNARVNFTTSKKGTTFFIRFPA